MQGCATRRISFPLAHLLFYTFYRWKPVDAMPVLLLAATALDLCYLLKTAVTMLRQYTREDSFTATIASFFQYIFLVLIILLHPHESLVLISLFAGLVPT